MPKTAVAISRHGSCHTSKTAILGKLFKDCYFRKVGVFHLICHVWLATRQELDEMVERDVIAG